MHWSRLIGVLLFPAAILIFPAILWAAHPLITDDSGTQGKGKFQLELNGQYDWDKETSDGVTVRSTGGTAAAILSYGIVDHADLVLSLPCRWGKIKEDDLEIYNEKGFSDTVLEVKWRFFEKEGLGLALKPGIRFPTGNHEKNLGSGKIGGHFFLIGSQEFGPWAFHANLGYIRNENKLDERKDIWHVSLATTREVVKNVRLVANVGQERNPEDSGKNDPAFLIGGVIYSVSENVDLDCGLKFGLNSSETDVSVLAGVTYRF